MPDEERIRAAMAGAERYLNAWHGRPSVRDEIAAIAEATATDERPDRYGAGGRIVRFEERVAELLGKDAAVFMPSGTMAQQIALRIWSDRKHTRTVAFHPTSHLELHEQKGYQMLHGLHGRLVGDPNRLITLKDLDGIHEPVAALLLELPQREIGGLLPTWDDLVAQTAWARDRGIALHMDGARLWESGPFYERAYAEIAGLFDSVYVSFYKGLGALAGAALAGDRAFIDEARVWQRRHGGNLVTLHPLVVSAELGLEQRLAPIAGYVEHARAIAAALATIDGVEVIPDPPQTPMFHLLLRGDRERLSDAALSLAEGRRIFLFADPSPTGSPSWQRLEVVVGAVSFAISPDEARTLFAEILAEAAKPRPRPRRGGRRSPRRRSPRRPGPRPRSPAGGGTPGP
jgi:threonine aldolase